ncbi:DUF4190 domain-containing protein [Nesterenkonia sandarakina]|uniref:Uncharacterized protein DUF4352 n=1 Tax=Nesterenkonia sandarakina TaxID=272918 RepID=A0A2T0YD24_9MICC|nr:DUF4190 domain-containing protein [Nesterenkonia sandarakina]PRZ12707.1 uncharacterized protein DUF4352 [Nesterenkonia sandarakina]
MSQENYTQYDYPPPGYQGWQQYQEPPQPKGLGIAAMIVGIVALVLSFIPLLGLISFVLGPLALILGIFGLVKNNGKPQAITGIITGALSFIVVLIGTLIFGAAVSSMDDSGQASIEDATELEAAEEQAEEAGEVAEAQEEEAEPVEAQVAGDPGSRTNPYEAGETVSNDEWEVTINGITRDADDAINAENQFSDPAPEGSSYALIDVTMTYLGDESEMPVFATDVAYVTAGGETLSAYETVAIAPDAFDSLRELYNGGTEQGNIVIAIPDEDEGTLRVRLGFLGREDHFYVAE